MSDDACYMCFEEKQLNNDGTSCWCDSGLEVLAYPKCTRNQLRTAVTKHASLFPRSAERLIDALDEFDGMPVSQSDAFAPAASVARVLYNDVVPKDKRVGMVGNSVLTFLRTTVRFLREKCNQDIWLYESSEDGADARIVTGATTIVA